MAIAQSISLRQHTISRHHDLNVDLPTLETKLPFSTRCSPTQLHWKTDVKATALGRQVSGSLEL